jgi:hypothetical protein
MRWEMATYGADKDTAKLIKAAEKAGWTVTLTGNNHLKFLPPAKDQPILIGALTGCGPGQKMLRRQLAKAGVTV